ncbi:hypothetical protein [Polyangium fumosum]|nr:hypothetical protein [Polyangium fumosum]
MKEEYAMVAILDVTGIRIVDTHIAQALVHAAQAAGTLQSGIARAIRGRR